MLRSRPKRWFLGCRFVGVGGIPDFGHAFSNYTYFRTCGRFSLNYVQPSWRSGGEKIKKKERKKEEETLVKYKSRRHTMSGGLTTWVNGASVQRRDGQQLLYVHTSPVSNGIGVTSNVTGRRRGPKRKLRSGYRAPSLQPTFYLWSSSVTDIIAFIVECVIARFLYAMRVFEVRASSSSPRLPLCQVSFLSRPLMLS